VPLRIEIGPKDLEEKSLVLVRRDTGEKIKIKQTEIIQKISELLDLIQKNLFEKAKKFLEENTVFVKSYDEFKKAAKERKLIKAPWCGKAECENKIKEETGVTLRAIPFDEEPNGTCVYCNSPAKYVAYFSKAY